MSLPRPVSPPIENQTTSWNLLQVSDVLDLEFGQAMAELEPVLAWKPQRTSSPLMALIGGAESESLHPGSTLRVRTFPLLRGFAKPLPAKLIPSQRALVRRVLRQSSSPAATPLICTTPYFAGVAELWPGPVVYWLTDLIAEYAGADPQQVQALDARMCAAAALVCPNSARLSDYLVQFAGCDPLKIHVLPNATRATNLLPTVPTAPADLPSDVGHLPRPIAGVIGNLAGNMDWVFLEEAVERTPGMTWLFVGPTSMPIPDPPQRVARERLLQHPRAHFAGAKPYGDLAAYARSFDVAVLPYRRLEPTYSGSSTRFYEHLAACRPMIATRGFAELLEKESLLTLVDTAPQAAEALDQLVASAFNDGRIAARWEASRQGTWQVRAHSMRAALAARLQPGSDGKQASQL